MTIGNLVVGEKYIEPAGLIQIKCAETGVVCQMEFKPRKTGGWRGEPQIDMIEATIFDKDGNERHKVEGKFSDEIFSFPVTSPFEKKSLFKAPEMPPDNNLMYGMNYYALQLHTISETLRPKLPPTDSRFREDVRFWESQNLDKAQAEKDRLEKIQRDRRKEVLKILKE